MSETSKSKSTQPRAGFNHCLPAAAAAMWLTFRSRNVKLRTTWCGGSRNAPKLTDSTIIYQTRRTKCLSGSVLSLLLSNVKSFKMSYFAAKQFDRKRRGNKVSEASPSMSSSFRGPLTSPIPQPHIDALRVKIAPINLLKAVQKPLGKDRNVQSSCSSARNPCNSLSPSRGPWQPPCFFPSLFQSFGHFSQYSGNYCD